MHIRQTVLKRRDSSIVFYTNEIQEIKRKSCIYNEKSAGRHLRHKIITGKQTRLADECDALICQRFFFPVHLTKRLFVCLVFAFKFSYWFQFDRGRRYQRLFRRQQQTKTTHTHTAITSIFLHILSPHDRLIKMCKQYNLCGIFFCSSHSLQVSFDRVLRTTTTTKHWGAIDILDVCERTDR